MRPHTVHPVHSSSQLSAQSVHLVHKQTTHFQLSLKISHSSLFESAPCLAYHNCTHAGVNISSSCVITQWPKILPCDMFVTCSPSGMPDCGVHDRPEASGVWSHGAVTVWWPSTLPGTWLWLSPDVSHSSPTRHTVPAPDAYDGFHLACAPILQLIDRLKPILNIYIYITCMSWFMFKYM